METRKAMQLTYVDDQQHQSNTNNNININNNVLNLGRENNSMDLFLPDHGDRDLSALEDFLAGTD